MSTPFSVLPSFSGGKDSTAMILMMQDRGIEFLDPVMFDTGWEFPEMYEHIALFEKVSGRKVVLLESPKGFNEWMLKTHVFWNARTSSEKAGHLRRVGNGWPSPFRRWCTRVKTRALRHYKKGLEQVKGVGTIYEAIGYGADECFRPEKPGAIAQRKQGCRYWYPLIDWGVTEAEALAYCKARGFHWGGLYDIFHRVSCYCCPLQSLDILRKLREHRPELWRRMLEWEKEMADPKKWEAFAEEELIFTEKNPPIRFHHQASVHDLEERFALEEILK
jgi:3'-phosphoadenosine 5'-phosphosulfate sulfotransferase (PAPS reductase)/FAD synthetase